jgi:hypothetical protein
LDPIAEGRIKWLAQAKKREERRAAMALLNAQMAAFAAAQAQQQQQARAPAANAAASTSAAPAPSNLAAAKARANSTGAGNSNANSNPLGANTAETTIIMGSTTTRDNSSSVSPAPVTPGATQESAATTEHHRVALLAEAKQAAEEARLAAQEVEVAEAAAEVAKQLAEVARQAAAQVERVAVEACAALQAAEERKFVAASKAAKGGPVCWHRVKGMVQPPRQVFRCVYASRSVGFMPQVRPLEGLVGIRGQTAGIRIGMVSNTPY